MQFYVRVYPKSSRNTVSWSDEQGLKVWITAAPENSKANDALVKLLANRLGIPRSSVHILRGQRSRNKVIRLEGLTSEDVSRLDDSAGSDCVVLTIFSNLPPRGRFTTTSGSA